MFDNYIFHFKAIINFSIGLSLVIAIFYVFQFLSSFFQKKETHWLKPIVFKNNEIISTGMLTASILNILKVIKWLLILTVLYLMIPFVLQELPYSHDYAVSLMVSIQKDLSNIFGSLLKFIPNVFFIIVTVFLTRSLIRFLKFIFLAL